METLKEAILANEPNQGQEAAIFSEELELFLVACPGTGKTWSACRRFMWRHANRKNQLGGIALLSFTNTAIKEFQNAIHGTGRKELLSEPNYIGTLDSFIERFIINPFGHLYKGLKKRPRLFLSPRKGDRRNRRLQMFLPAGNRRTITVHSWEVIPARENKSDVFLYRDTYGNFKPLSRGREILENFFEFGLYTHSQRAYFAFILLNTRKHLVRCIVQRFPEIIVDEAQDTSVWQLKLLNLLRRGGAKITLIGDPDQCIYEFSLADVNALELTHKHWKTAKKNLNESFRCNEKIALAARKIVNNRLFSGVAPIHENEFHQPFIIRQPESDDGEEKALNTFKELLGGAEIDPDNSAVLCRSHTELHKIQGKHAFLDLKGKTKQVAQASYHRHRLRNYKKSYEIIYRILKEVVDDDLFWGQIEENKESAVACGVRLSIWTFIKEKLPKIDLEVDQWIEEVRRELTELVCVIKPGLEFSFSRIIKRTGLSTGKFLFEPNTPDSSRKETIHQVKGESLDAILLLGSSKFFNKVVAGIKTGDIGEENRLAYVALTRARHTLMVSLPARHFDKHHGVWQECGFQVFEKAVSSE